eukprot:gene1454-4613_t
MEYQEYQQSSENGFSLLALSHTFVVVLLAVFIVVFEPLRGLLYWLYYETNFGTGIGGTGGVGGQLGLTTCAEGFYCFWHDVAGVNLTYLALLTTIWWSGCWLTLAVLSWLSLPSGRNDRLEASRTYLVLCKQAMRFLAFAVIVWLGFYIIYYFMLSDFYRRYIVLGISLAAACALMMSWSLLLLTQGRFGLVQRLLHLKGITFSQWPTHLGLHRVLGATALLMAVIHGGGELVYTALTTKHIKNALLPNSDENEGDPIMLDGTIAVGFIIAQLLLLSQYTYQKGSSSWLHRSGSIFFGTALVLCIGMFVIGASQLHATREAVLYSITVMSLCVLIVIALSQFAQKWPSISFMLWRWLHAFIGFAATGATVLHFLPSIFFFLPGIALWMCDIAHSFMLRNWLKKNARVELHHINEYLMRVCVDLPLITKDGAPCTYFAGQQTFLLSLPGCFTTHPFSVVPTSQNSADLYIQSGDGKWTSRLRKSQLPPSLLGPFENMPAGAIQHAVESCRWKQISVVVAGSGLFGVLGVLDQLALNQIARCTPLFLHIILRHDSHIEALLRCRVSQHWPEQWRIIVMMTTTATKESDNANKMLDLQQKINHSLQVTNTTSQFWMSGDSLKNQDERDGSPVHMKCEGIASTKNQSQQNHSPVILPVKAIAPAISILTGLVAFLLIWSWRGSCCSPKTAPTVPTCNHCFSNCKPENCSVFFNGIAFIAVTLASTTISMIIGKWWLWELRQIPTKALQFQQLCYGVSIAVVHAAPSNRQNRIEQVVSMIKSLYISGNTTSMNGCHELNRPIMAEFQSNTQRRIRETDDVDQKRQENSCEETSLLFPIEKEQSSVKSLCLLTCLPSPFEESLISKLDVSSLKIDHHALSFGI